MRFILLLSWLLAAAALGASPYHFTYSGRLTEATGKPVVGPRHLEISFFAAASGGSPLVTPVDFPVAEVREGVFILPLALDPDDYHAVFKSTASPYVQIKDVTADKTYPRQLFTAVPYALKVPVDDSLAYDDDGNLGISKVGAGPDFVLKFVNGKWVPAGITGANGGTVEDVEVGSGLTLNGVPAGALDDPASIVIGIQNGGVTDSMLAGSIAQSKITNLVTDLSGKAATAHSHGNAELVDLDATKLTGTVDPARYSAYADLSAETKIGPGAAQVAAGNHNHDAAYSLLSHNHDAAYAAIGHNHNATYSLLGHNHDASYAALIHAHSSLDAASGGPAGYLVLDNIGNVAIGTTGTAYALDISKNLSADNVDLRLLNRATTGNSVANIALQGANGAVGADWSVDGLGTVYGVASRLATITNHPLAFATNGVSHVVLDTSVRLGVGSLSPGSKLDVAGTATATRLNAVNAAAPNGASVTTGYFAAGPNELGVQISSYPHATPANRYVSISAGDSGADRPLVLNPNGGNVGVGSTTPGARFEVAGSTDTTQLVVKGHTTQTSNLQEWQTSAGTTLAAIDMNGSYTGQTKFVGAHVYSSTDLSTTNAVSYNIQFNSETYDSHGFHDNAVNSHRFTIPAGYAGYYMVGCHTRWVTNVAGERFTGITKNSVTDLARDRRGSTGEGEASPVTTVYLAAGDYVQCYVMQTSGGNLSLSSGGGYPKFWITLIGR